MFQIVSQFWDTLYSTVGNSQGWSEDGWRPYAKNVLAPHGVPKKKEELHLHFVYVGVGFLYY